MKHYYLRPGDYVQQGDEFFSKKYQDWLPIEETFIGKKYGYDLQNPQKRATWTDVRRLVPDDFELKPTRHDLYIQEQWGEEFER